MARMSLESLCQRISSGGTPPRKNFNYFTNAATGHLWVKSKELIDCGIDNTEERISDEGLNNSSAKYYPENTVLIAMYGANVGQLGWLRKPATVNQAICGLLVDDKKADWRFVFYALLRNRGDLTIQAQGAAQQNLNLDSIRQFFIDVPPLRMQRRIASILSAYDDLIENNQRRIKILETMARALYREWFVHFRFPGHENHPRVASPLGEIPEEWEIKRLPECVDVNPRVTVPREGEKSFVPMGCLSNDSMLISDIESRDGNSGAKFKNGDTLFARITPCLENGKTGFVQFLPDDRAVGFGSTEFIVLRSRTLSPEFVYLLARSDEFRNLAIKSMSGATGRQRVQERCFDDFQICQPPPQTLEVFSEIAAPMFQLIFELHLKNQNLRRTRDLLLPRLLSGHVSFSDLEADSIYEAPASDAAPTAQAPACAARALNPAPKPTIATEPAPAIDDTERQDVLCTIRQVFNDGGARDRDSAIRDIAHALGYQRTGSRIRKVVSGDLATAVRRGIVTNDGGVYRLGYRSYAECTRESLKSDFESAIGRAWIEREDAIRAFARWGGFGRVGPVIEETARSLINGLIREGRLETEGPDRIRRV